MSHFAQIKNGIVQQVIVAEQDFINMLPDSHNWIQTSYNTRGNVHLLGGTPLRGNFAGVGFQYDTIHDVFYTQQPFLSWTLNTNTWIWEPPTPYPNDGKQYQWNETKQSWVHTNLGQHDGS
jgi:hypothetical protein